MSNKRNIKLLIAYDGTAYKGWQEIGQKLSIEHQLHKVLEQITQESIKLQAASRTDSGVHANGQVVNFFLEKCPTDTSTLRRSLNRILPSDISIWEAIEEEEGFHPTTQCGSKTYHYNLCRGFTQDPLRRLYSWHYPQTLNIENMREASKSLIGEHDFSAFVNVDQNSLETNFIRDLLSIDLMTDDNALRIEITGNRFLFKMVRNVVGTLVFVGRGKLQVEDVAKILESKDRTKGGITAPAHGLTLHEVHYG